jgi:cell division control protein 6
MMALKTALHLSAVPSSILCREMEQEKVIRFCKTAVLEQRPGSMYVCGRPGTGKSLIMEKVKILCTDWTKEANMQTPEIISLNCTSLTDPRNIYQKVLQLLKPNQGTEVIQSSAVCLKEIKKRVCDSLQRSVNHSKRMLYVTVLLCS